MLKVLAVIVATETARVSSLQLQDHQVQTRPPQIDNYETTSMTARTGFPLVRGLNTYIPMRRGAALPYPLSLVIRVGHALVLLTRNTRAARQDHLRPLLSGELPPLMQVEKAIFGARPFQRSWKG